jgi:hypothetical protein
MTQTRATAQVKARFLMVGERFQRGPLVAVVETRPVEACKESGLFPAGLWSWEATVLQVAEPELSQFGEQEMGLGQRIIFAAWAEQMVFLVGDE